jgi:chromosome segregation protein
VRLNSIKLSGFKSFVDSTSLQVQGQLVGVVGPNGCGKSNIIDAVRWVLGESRASELRGESMRDVIFNGSTRRKPSGRASVELVFDNSEGRAFGQWGQYAEIAVKRVLTREGGSTFHINNMPVRRRDIQDIFLGTGLGPRAYAIIGQGMISRIIEARPEDLRTFLEEAAGVSKYKERRRETENRLHDTRENLLRVGDILRELNLNLEKLEIQAEVVKKYHTLQAEHDEQQKLLWLLHRQEARLEQSKLAAETEQAQTGLEEQIAGLRHVETALEHLRQSQHAASDLLHAAQGQLYQTNSEIGTLEAQIRYVIESRSRLQAQIGSYQQQSSQWRQTEQRHKEELEEARMQLEELIVRVEESGQKVEQENGRLPLLEQAWRDSQQQSGKVRAEIMQIQQQIELASAHHRNASGSLSDLAVRRERLMQEKGSLHMPDEADISSLRIEQEEKQAVLEEERIQQAYAQEQQSLLEEGRRAAQRQLEAYTTGLAQTEARLSTLKQIQEKVQSESKVQPWLKKHELDGLPRLWQKLHIEAGWETALESVLRERTSALQVSNIDWAKGFFTDLPPAKLALFSSSANNTATGCEAAAGLTPFHALLKVQDESLGAVLQEWLHHVYAAQDPATAFAEREKLPPGGYFVLPQGHLIGKTSVRFYAASSEQEGMLARQQEIDSLTGELQSRQFLVQEGKSQATQAEAGLAQCTRQIQDAHQRINALTQALHALQIQVLKQNELRERSQQRGAQIEAVLAEIAEQEAEHRQSMGEAEEKFEQLDAVLAQLQESESRTQLDHQAKELQLADARQRLREYERAAQEAGFAEKSLRNRIGELQRHIETAQEQAAQLAGSLEQGQLELQELDDQLARENLQSLLEKRMEQERVMGELRQKLDDISHQLRRSEEQRMQTEQSLQPQRDKIVALQLKEQAARLNVERYAQQLADGQADEAALAGKLHSGMKPAFLQAEAVRIAAAIDDLGPVNLAAPGELAQASERRNFLEAQNKDLTEAINTLEDAIRRIDRETRALLQDTFDNVNRNFGELFPLLFGGGQARLTMVGDEILDCGVQVMAQPPGKKNATIHLLSGGEKTMAAIALVFSLFQLNPAPFCLLDEVDAPLDDSNTERFCKMVRSMSAKTQFLFISHNKIAMEIAEQLIGVTMQEQGVSRIVVVDIQSAMEFSTEVHAA